MCGNPHVMSAHMGTKPIKRRPTVEPTRSPIDDEASSEIPCQSQQRDYYPLSLLIRPPSRNSITASVRPGGAPLLLASILLRHLQGCFCPLEGVEGKWLLSSLEFWPRNCNVYLERRIRISAMWMVNRLSSSNRSNGWLPPVLD